MTAAIDVGTELVIIGSVRGVYYTDVGQRVEGWLSAGLYRVVSVGGIGGVPAVVITRGNREWWVARSVAERYVEAWS